jgi:Fem-1 family protein b
MVQYFLSLPDRFTITDRICSYELLAASYANNSDNYDIEKCYQNFETAMLLRYNDPDKVIVKNVNPPEKDFGFQLESQTLEELQKICNDEDKINTESLLAKERIYGKYNMPTLDLIYRGAVMADKQRFDISMALWKRASLIKRHNNESIAHDLERFCELFSEMLESNSIPDVDIMMEILSMSLDEIRLDLERLTKRRHHSEVTRIQRFMIINVNAFIFLVSAILSLEKSHKKIFKTKSIVYKLIKLDPRVEKNNDSLLHIICNAEVKINEYFDPSLTSFPNIPMLKVLLECGADPDVYDSNYNTPLHLLCDSSMKIDSSASLVCEAAKLLIDNGAHIDFTNDKGEKPIDLNILNGYLIGFMRNRSLKCLAACKVKSYQLEYKDVLPYSLIEFVKRH